MVVLAPEPRHLAIKPQCFLVTGVKMRELSVPEAALITVTFALGIQLEAQQGAVPPSFLFLLFSRCLH